MSRLLHESCFGSRQEHHPGGEFRKNEQLAALRGRGLLKFLTGVSCRETKDGVVFWGGDHPHDLSKFAIVLKQISLEILSHHKVITSDE